MIELLLPEELKAEILKRVPNKDLLQCTAVCKSWYALIKSSFFIFQTHLPHVQSSNSNPHLVILCHYFDPNDYARSYHDDDTEDFTECRLPPHFYKYSNLSLFASCNGLLLFRDCSDYIILWNPSICRSLMLPKPNLSSSSKGCYDELSGLGFDSSTHDFKVLRILCGCENPGSIVKAEAEVYSVNAGSWKNITLITPQFKIPYHIYFQHQSIPFVNGALHMIAHDCKDKGQNLVLVFDVKDEIFREILLPHCLQNALLDMLFVIAYGQSIAVVHFDDSDFWNDIWVMKEYGLCDSWTNLGKLQNEEYASAAIFFRKNGQFMIDSGLGKIFSFDFATQTFVDLFPGVEEMEGNGSASVFSYIETLALLDRGNFGGRRI